MKSYIKKLIPAIIVFIIGYALTIVGALFKIQHWPNGGEIYTVGSLIEVVAIVIAILTLIKIYKSKN